MKNNIHPSHSVRLTVPFHDLDPMRIVWHGNYLKYFEIARDALFSHLGFDIYDFYRDSGYLFPIVRSQVKHIHPLKLRDTFICRAELVETRRKLSVEFQIRLESDDKLCTTGRSEQVAVRQPDFELELMIPEAVRKALGEDI